MPFIGGGHMWLILILLVVALIVFGPKKLPDIGHGMGRAIREFRKAATDSTPPAPGDAAPVAAHDAPARTP